MKRVILICILPFVISIVGVYSIALNKSVNDFLFKKSQIEKKCNDEYRFIENFYNNPDYENQFLKCGDSFETIFLLGSSELTSATAATPFNFISQHFTTQLKGVGHAGNQCFSIFTQLLANENRLKNAPIIIILSPGWFESKPSKGTSSAIFLEFNSERFVNKIINNKENSEFQYYAYKRIAQLYTEFNSPNLELKMMNFKYRASKSFIHQAIFTPLILFDSELLKLKENIIPLSENNDLQFKRFPIVSESVSINWDSLFAESRQEVLKKSTNNNMAIADDYFSEYIHDKIGHMEPVAENLNQELEDFKVLIKFLKEKKVNASFIISPLNPFYYKNLIEILPTINIVENEIKLNDLPYLNLLETDTIKYDKGILHDVMHMSDYGWYKVDSFIINTYHLSK